MGMILLDTTILVYATGGDHPLRQPCRAIVRAIGDRQVVATTTVEVIQEFAHVRGRRDGRPIARELALAFCRLLEPLQQPDHTDVERGLDLFERHSALGSFDSVLAACAIGRPHLSGVLSADSGFDDISGLTRYDPASSADLATLGVTIA